MTAEATTTDGAKRGMEFRPVFSTRGVHPYDEIEWSRRDARITDAKTGAIVFEQKDVEVPQNWSQTATDIVFEKYAYGAQPGREASVRQVVGRVVEAITRAGVRWGYFRDVDHSSGPDADSAVFATELTWLLIHQHASFNSPVWFNVGCRPGRGFGWDFGAGAVRRCSKIDEDRYQGSACFIVSVEDTIESIADNAKTEMLIFKDGSGAGSDRSRLRSSLEPVSGGGRASGPVSFMRVYDAVGATTKSGGISRRAAKMEILRCDHPDIMEFIGAKSKEEKKAHALIREGYEANFNGEAYNSVLYQNSNMSVRVTDRFLQAVEAGEDWQTLAVGTGTAEAADGTPMPRYKAAEILDAMAAGTWECGDPGIQYDDMINRWHTTPSAGKIVASNPCSEYVNIDDSSCNLASLNLMKFRRDDGTFDVARFRAACRTLIVAMDILVDLGSYPTAKIAENAHRFRQLGLGFANLGAILMSLGLPYDSDEGRSLAGAITSLMTASAYEASAELSVRLGTFDGFGADCGPMLGVIEMHRKAAWGDSVASGDAALEIWDHARSIWNDVVGSGRGRGFRNSVVSLLAPTGTIAFMMDCDTTGIEPDVALVKYKHLWGRGLLKLVNRTVPMALATLGYYENEIEELTGHIDAHDTIEGSRIQPEHLPVFDCAFPPANGTEKRSIHWTGHVQMMAAVQPHLSMAISKTVNMPADATVADIRAAYMLGWKLGLKALAIYRDGSKESQPVTTSRDGDASAAKAPLPPAATNGHAPVTGSSIPRRRRLPAERAAVCHKFSVDGMEGYLHVGLYPDGAPGELFVKLAKEGSTLSGAMDAWATSVSMMLQYGVPLDVIVEKFRGSRYEPSGFTANPDIPMASSISDYIARWLEVRFLVAGGNRVDEALEAEPLASDRADDYGGIAVAAAPARVSARFKADTSLCRRCGGLMVPTGTCWTCTACGTGSGGCS